MLPLPSLSSLAAPVRAWRAVVRQDIDAGMKLVERHPCRRNAALALRLIENGERRLVSALPGDVHGIVRLGRQRAQVVRLLALARPDASVPGTGHTPQERFPNFAQRLLRVATFAPGPDARLQVCLTPRRQLEALPSNPSTVIYADTVSSRATSIASCPDGGQPPYEAIGPLARQDMTPRSSKASSVLSSPYTRAAGREDSRPSGLQSLSHAQYRALMAQIEPHDASEVVSQLLGFDRDLQNMFDNYSCFSGKQDLAALDGFIAKAEAGRTALTAMKVRYTGIRQAMDMMVKHYRDQNVRSTALEEALCREVRARQLGALATLLEGPLAQFGDVTQFDASASRALDMLTRMHGQVLDCGKLSGVQRTSAEMLTNEAKEMIAARRTAITETLHG